jgi:hypothetical protein
MQLKFINNKFFLLFLAFVIIGTISFLAIKNAASGENKVDPSNVQLVK